MSRPSPNTTTHTEQAFPDLGAAHFELPLSPIIARGNDEGRPVVLADPQSKEAEVCIYMYVYTYVLWGWLTESMDAKHKKQKQVYTSLARHVGQEVLRRRCVGTVIVI